MRLLPFPQRASPMLLLLLLLGSIGSSPPGATAAPSCVNLFKMQPPDSLPHPRVFNPAWRKESKIHTSSSNLPDLTGRSVYWWGDSTLRQIAHGTMQKIRATKKTGGEFKAFVRTCPGQGPARSTYIPDPGPDQHQCWLNEHRCEDLPMAKNSLGKKVSMSWDWKHLMYEDYDRWRLDSWVKGREPAPDILIIGPGLHDCSHHAGDVEFHLTQLDRLMDHLALLPLTTQVVMLDVVPFDNNNAMPCVERVNEAMLASRHLTSNSTNRMWLFRRSTPILGSKRELQVHVTDDVIRSLSKMLLLQLHCVAAAMQEQRQQDTPDEEQGQAALSDADGAATEGAAEEGEEGQEGQEGEEGREGEEGDGKNQRSDKQGKEEGKAKSKGGRNDGEQRDA